MRPSRDGAEVAAILTRGDPDPATAGDVEDLRVREHQDPDRQRPARADLSHAQSMPAESSGRNDNEMTNPARARPGRGGTGLERGGRGQDSPVPRKLGENLDPRPGPDLPPPGEPPPSD